MIECYKKLDIKMPNMNVVRGKHFDRYGIEENGKFLGVEYGEFFLQDKKSIQNLNDFLSIIPESKKDYFFQSYMYANSILYPHIDNNINSCINIYVRVNGGKTTFHNVKEKATDIKNEVGKLEGYSDTDRQVVYGFEDVEDVCHFNAEVGDVYIMNTSMLHSVTEVKGERMAITLQSKLPIDEVIKIFKGV